MTAPDLPALAVAVPPEQRLLPAAVGCLFLLVGAAAAAVFRHGNLPGAASRPWEPWVVFALVAVAGLLLAALLQRQAWERARTQAQGEHMRAKVEQLSLVAQLTHNAVLITDAAGLITWVNPSFERITGYSAAEAVGRSSEHLLQCPQTDPATVALVRDAMRTGRPSAGEILNRNKQGRLYWMAFDIQPMHDAQGRLMGFTIIKTDLTERKRNEAELHASRAFLHNTGRIAGVGGWQLDLRSGEIKWTEQARIILGLEQHAKPTVADILEWCTPQARAEVQQAAAQGALQGQSWDLELAIVTPAGRSLWLRVLTEGEYDDSGAVRLTGALLDITASRAMRAESQRNAELLRGAIDAVDEAFVLYDRDDRLVLCNDKYRDLFRVSRNLIVPGVPFEDILRNSVRNGQFPDAIGRVDEWVAECMHKHRSGNVVRIQHVSDGRVLRIIDRRMADGHTVGFRIDLTDLWRAKEAAELARRAQEDFIATMSHELRTPLQAITGFSDLGKVFAEDQPQFLSMFTDIHAGGMRMLQLINGLLDVSKIEGNAGALALRIVDVGALAEDVAAELRGLASERTLQLELPTPRPRLLANVDAVRMMQVIRNVLANAIRFAPEGSVIELGGIHLGAEGVRLSVRDHGPGIPEDELDMVFDAFAQSSRTRDGSGGTGLGLTICRKLMGAFGGSITAANAQGGGALFCLNLPAATGAAAPTLPPPEERVSEHAAPAAKLETA
jgi:PAS domain S-box-containing protein